jgi:signal transduction histidine kinase
LSLGHRRVSAPIAVQIALLIALCLILAQAIALLVLVLSPPPAPQVYRLTEIAAALQGGSLEPRLGRPLTREIVDTPPPPHPLSRREIALSRRSNAPILRAFGRGPAALAKLLGVDASRVRIVRPPSSWPARLIDGPGVGEMLLRRDRPPPPGDTIPDLPPPELNAALAPPVYANVPSEIWRLSPRSAEVDFVGDFIAALRRDDGRWVRVEPRSEPFPNDWQRKVGLWMLGCLLVSTSAGWLFARRITAPIDRFAEAAQRLGREPSALPIGLEGPAEIGKAAAAFNEMQVRLKRYVGDRTAMVGAISHDLRTPLARIRFKLEAKSPDPGAILSDVQQMEAMIASVLTFIRDANNVSSREKLDLLSVIEVVVDDAAMVGGAAQIVDGQALTVDGDAIALQRLMANLVDNALKYGGAARVRMSSHGGLAVVEVDDDGPGMAQADLARAFEPFWRIDAARNLDKGGVGLGLAVARSLARAHGGDVELVNRPPRQGASGGMTARVTLPLA